MGFVRLGRHAGGLGRTCSAPRRSPTRRGMPSRCTASRRCRRASPSCATPIRMRPKGGRLVQGVRGTFDSLNPFIVKGLSPQGIRGPLSGGNVISGYVVESLMARGHDEPFTLYGLVAQHGRDRRRPQLRHLQSRSGGAVLRRRSDHARGRDLFLAAPARPRTAESSLLLFQGAEGRSRRRPRCAVRSRRQRRSRAAADSRPDAGAAQARDQSRDLRADVAHAADRQRPLRRSHTSTPARA